MLRRRVYFMGRWIKHGGIYPTYLLRIFRHGKAICEQALMDEHFLLTEGESVRFSKDLIDNNTKEEFKKHVEKINFSLLYCP